MHIYLIGTMQLGFWIRMTIWLYFKIKIKCKFKCLSFFLFLSVMPYNDIFTKASKLCILLSLTENLTISSRFFVNFSKILSQRLLKAPDNRTNYLCWKIKQRTREAFQKQYIVLFEMLTWACCQIPLKCMLHKLLPDHHTDTDP